MGSMFFASVDETLWGDVAIAMLTLFRVATFEDWTDYVTLALPGLLLTRLIACATLSTSNILHKAKSAQDRSFKRGLWRLQV